MGSKDRNLFDLMLNELESSLGSNKPQTEVRNASRMGSDTKIILKKIGTSVEEMERSLQEALQPRTRPPVEMEIALSLQGVELSLRQMQLLMLPHLNMLSALEKDKPEEEKSILTRSHAILVMQDFRDIGDIFHKLNKLCTLMAKMRESLQESASD